MKKCSICIGISHTQIKPHSSRPNPLTAMFKSLTILSADKDELPEAAGWKTH